jgi:hypothetical protein
MVLTGVFLILLTGWLLWGWIVAEAHQWPLVKLWCARSFVVMTIIVCLGGATWVSQRVIRSAQRSAVSRLAVALRDAMDDGRIEDVSRALHDLADPPDELSNRSGDILKRLESVTTALNAESGKRRADRIAAKRKEPNFQR